MRRGDDLTTFVCRVSSNLGALTDQNPSRPHRPVTGIKKIYIILNPNFLDSVTRGRHVEEPMNCLNSQLTSGGGQDVGTKLKVADF